MRATRSRARPVAREAALTVGALLGVVCLVATVAATFLGVTPLVFRSGSMAPAVPTGALALARHEPASAVRVGQVVSVHSATGVRISHRVQAVRPQGGIAMLTLKGDANARPDAETYPVTEAEGVDRVMWHVSGAGYVVSAMSSSWVVFLTGGFVAGLFFLAFARRSGPPDPPEDDDTRSETPSDGSTGGRLRRAVGPVSVVSAAVALFLGAVPVVPTSASFTDSATARTGTVAANPWFSCNDSILSGAPAGPEFYYKLDESTGNSAADSSGNVRTGTYSAGGRTPGAPRACSRDGGTAMTFSSSSNTGGSYLVSPAAAQLGVFTIAIWFRTTTVTGGRMIGYGSSARATNSTNSDRHLYLGDNGAVLFGVSPNAVRTVSSPGTYNDGAWHQALASLSGAGMKLYVDGALVASSAATTTAQAYTGFWRVGGDTLKGWTNQPTSYYFNGTLDEAVVYNVALTDAQVAAQWRSGQ